MRIAKWDNLKFVLIYFVVLGHFIGIFKCDSFFLKGLQFFIYTFHMPAFLFISGLFSKRTIDERRYDKVFPYFFLYIFMKGLRFVVHFLIHGKTSSFSFWSESGVPWFALTLLLCYLITIAVSHFPSSYVMIMAVCIGILAGYDCDLGDFLTGMRTLTFYPFFFAGYCVPIKKVTEFTEKKIVKVFSFGLLLAVLTGSFLFETRVYNKLGFLKGKASYAALHFERYGGIFRGTYYVIALALILAVIALTPSVNCFVTKWGSRTLQVFALHFSALRILQDGMNLKGIMKELTPNYYGYLIPLMAFILTSILSAGVFEPFFRWLMHPVKKGKIERV